MKPIHTAQMIDVEGDADPDLKLEIMQAPNGKFMAVEQRVNGPAAVIILDDAALAAIDKARHGAARSRRQRVVYDWGVRCFGPEHMVLPQRGLRFLEEAMELAQAAGVPVEMAHHQVDKTYERPVGKIAQEIGGVGNTLLALAESAGLGADECERAEIERCLALPPEHFTKRNEEKNALGLVLVDKVAA